MMQESALLAGEHVIAPGLRSQFWASSLTFTIGVSPATGIIGVIFSAT